jgi:nucleotide-binding universal stress UspA family protein
MKERLMKNLVLHAEDHPDFAHRLGYARDLATALGAHLHVICPVPFSTVASADYSGVMLNADLIARQHKDDRERAVRVKAVCDDALALLGSAWTFADPDGEPLQIMIDAARFADLVIVGAQESEAGFAPMPIAGSLALHCIAPVLVIPNRPCTVRLEAPVIIGWNGSNECARATHLALPLLARTTQVHVVQVEEPDSGLLPDVELGAYLSRHGLPVRIQRERSDGSIARTLGQLAETLGAGLLVTGAYGRPRLLEMVFGGASRDLLARPPLPVLMAH